VRDAMTEARWPSIAGAFDEIVVAVASAEPAKQLESRLAQVAAQLGAGPLQVRSIGVSRPCSASALPRAVSEARAAQRLGPSEEGCQVQRYDELALHRLHALENGEHQVDRLAINDVHHVRAQAVRRQRDAARSDPLTGEPTPDRVDGVRRAFERVHAPRVAHLRAAEVMLLVDAGVVRLLIEDDPVTARRDERAVVFFFRRGDLDADVRRMAFDGRDAVRHVVRRHTLRVLRRAAQDVAPPPPRQLRLQSLHLLLRLLGPILSGVELHAQRRDRLLQNRHHLPHVGEGRAHERSFRHRHGMGAGARGEEAGAARGWRPGRGDGRGSAAAAPEWRPGLKPRVVAATPPFGPWVQARIADAAALRTR